MAIEIFILGAEGVGKTSVRKVLSGAAFSSAERPTSSIDFATIHGLTGFNLSDMSGSQRFLKGKGISENCRAAHIILLCFDVNNHDSLKATKKWHESVMSGRPKKEAPIFLLVGTKRDVTTPSINALSEEEIQKFAKTLNIIPERVILTSAKTPDNLDKLKRVCMEITLDIWTVDGEIEIFQNKLSEYIIAVSAIKKAKQEETAALRYLNTLYAEAFGGPGKLDLGQLNSSVPVALQKARLERFQQALQSFDCLFKNYRGLKTDARTTYSNHEVDHLYAHMRTFSARNNFDSFSQKLKRAVATVLLIISGAIVGAIVCGVASKGFGAAPGAVIGAVSAANGVAAGLAVGGSAALGGVIGGGITQAYFWAKKTLLKKSEDSSPVPESTASKQKIVSPLNHNAFFNRVTRAAVLFEQEVKKELKDNSSLVQRVGSSFRCGPR